MSTALSLCAARGWSAPGLKRVDVPLTTELPSALGACAIDRAALSSRTGFRVLTPLPGDRVWTVRVVAASERLTVILLGPDGVAVASKPLDAARTPCPALVELVAVLLSAHVPKVALAAPASAPAPAPGPASRPVQRVAPGEQGKQVGPAEPVARAEAVARRAEARRHVYVGVGGGMEGFGDGSAGFGMARAHVQLWRHLAAGGQVLVSYRDRGVAGGEASIWAVDGRLSAGLLLRSGQLIWSAAALVGARLTHGSSTGLQRDGSGTVGALGLGLSGDVWFVAGRHLRLGLGTNMVLFLPRAAFEVEGAGQVYRTPLPAVEIHLSAGWER